MTDAPQGVAWINALRIPRQRDAIAWLNTWAQVTDDVSSFAVGCSIGRGAADDLSDVDAAIGVHPTGAAAIARIEQTLVGRLAEIGEVIAVQRTGEQVRRMFVQYADRLQLDLAIVAEPLIRRGSAAPDFVTVYRAGVVPDAKPGPSAYEVPPDLIDEWTFAGWRALLDADKYLKRDSPWEAHRQLEQARQQIWRLWAVIRGASYPQHGLLQVLDETPDDLPAGIEGTVAGLDPDDLRRAVETAAAILADCAAGATEGAGEPAMARYVREQLGC